MRIFQNVILPSVFVENKMHEIRITHCQNQLPLFDLILSEV